MTKIFGVWFGSSENKRFDFEAENPNIATELAVKFFQSKGYSRHLTDIVKVELIADPVVIDGSES